MWAAVENGAVTQVMQDGQPFSLNGVAYPSSWFTDTTTEEKAALGIFPMTRDPDPIPPGFYSDASTYEILPTQVIEHLHLVEQPPFTPDQLKNYARDKELRVETGGINFLGQSVPTDREQQGMYSRAAAYAALPDPASRRMRFLKPGGFMVLTLEQTSELARAVEEHVLLAIDAAAQIYAEIDAGVIQTTGEIETSPLWPPNG